MRKYIDDITATLAKFQYIEEFLRMYIQKVNSRIRKTMKGKIPYKYSEKWVKKDSLGTLIDKFEKNNDNKILIKRLKSLVPERNKIAHKGLLITRDQIVNVSSVKLKKEKLKKIRISAGVALNRINDEIRKIEK
ncbi:MAG: hypothetical protein PHU64_02655 [Candidatus Omnitrophica bacterium]|nr:hypothetical protein [Candidatus Omnitrophota bacterium]MDD5430494.1 hypothetical protein [Candidatus Omnitrophota bacterium]